MKFKHCLYPVLIQPTQIPEMKEIVETQDGLRIGASVTLNEMEETLKLQIREKPGRSVNFEQNLTQHSFSYRMLNI